MRGIPMRSIPPLEATNSHMRWEKYLDLRLFCWRKHDLGVCRDKVCHHHSAIVNDGIVLGSTELYSVITVIIVVVIIIWVVQTCATL